MPARKTNGHLHFGSATPTGAQVIDTYLTAVLPIVSDQFSSAAARGGAQVHILGMADMLRIVHDWSLADFVTAYGRALEEWGLSPRTDVRGFVRKIALGAYSHPEIEQMMQVSAMSMRSFTVEKDSDAPLELAQAVMFAMAHARLFEPIGKS